MRRRLFSFLVLLPLALPKQAYPQAPDLPRVGVWDLESETVPMSELRLLSDRLRVELFSTGQFTVVERQRMEEILKEQGFQQSGCTTTECVVEVGQLLGAEKMVAGSVGRVGAVYTISLRVINVETGALERTAVKDCRCTIEDILTTTIAQVAAELAGTTVTIPTPLRREQGVGMLYLASTPLGAQIILDGRPRREVTPATLDRLPAGEHILRLFKEHLVAEQQVTIIRDDLVKLTVELHPGTGSVFVTSDPLEAEVLVDGQRAGTTPLLLRDIVVGQHTVRVAIADYLPWEDQVVVAFNERANIPVTLQPAGYLDIEIQPPNASVRINDRLLTGGERHLMLPAGEYQVTATLADYDTLVRTMSIAHGVITPLHGRLASRFGRVRITSTPEGASVSSTPVGISGNTPLSVGSVTPGSYLIRVTMPQRAPHEQTIVVRRDETSEVRANLVWLPEVIAKQEREKLTSRIRWTSLAIGAVAFGIAVKFNNDAAGAYDDARDAYSRYTAATTGTEATHWRRNVEAASAYGRGKEKQRRISYIVGGVGLGVGIVLSIR